MKQKITHCERSKISPKKLYDRVLPVKLQACSVQTATLL